MDTSMIKIIINNDFKTFPFMSIDEVNDFKKHIGKIDDDNYKIKKVKKGSSDSPFETDIFLILKSDKRNRIFDQHGSFIVTDNFIDNNLEDYN
jgi:hypothetical protein